MKKRYFLLCLIFVLLFCGCGDQKRMIIKDGLIGIWKTPEPRYKGCSFALTKDLIVFSNGYTLNVLDAFLLNNIDVNYILKIRKQKKKDELPLYTVFYENMNRQEFKLSFYLDPEERKIIFKNQQYIEWWKEGEMKMKTHVPKRDKKQKWFVL